MPTRPFFTLIALASRHKFRLEYLKLQAFIIYSSIQSFVPVPVGARSNRRRSAAARLLRSWVRIPPGTGCLSVVSVVCGQVEVSATS